MNYSLAKELKEAGFKDGHFESYLFPDGTYKAYYTGEEGAVYLPSLSEIIEACGAFFGALTNKQTHWVAVSADLKHIVEGSTPSEAVAKLWLQLNIETNG